MLTLSSSCWSQGKITPAKLEANMQAARQAAARLRRTNRPFTPEPSTPPHEDRCQDVPVVSQRLDGRVLATLQMDEGGAEQANAHGLPGTGPALGCRPRNGALQVRPGSMAPRSIWATSASWPVEGPSEGPIALLPDSPC